ncbi:hypothetical protein ACJJTC_014385 [Scirpophaga incertulas]
MFVKLLFLYLLRAVDSFSYFHELSKATLKPNEMQIDSEFGLAMDYQGGESRKLIVGAPHSDLVGKVYTCDIRNVFANKTKVCEHVPIDVDKLAPYSREYTPELKLNLGASIAATPDYFLTCAPLWTTTLNFPSSNFSYGTCFVYNGSVHRYQGRLEAGLYSRTSNNIYGGIGWNILVDKENNNLLIAKVFPIGDVYTLKATDPLAQVDSYGLTNPKSKNPFPKLDNVGYAMAAGQFFNPNVTLYAFSVTTTSTRGMILFLRSEDPSSKTKQSKKRLQFIKYKNAYVNITDPSMGIMFGAALHAADLNKDGRSELLVGAPVQDDAEGGYEMGALHIYISDKLTTLTDDNMRRVILGTENGGRFGTAIATSDVDGDGFPEIFVSAPYDGPGVLYILSGLEIETELLKFPEFKQISLSKLKLSQKIQSMDSRTFGRSLKIIPDLDDNGCDELAVGSPGSNEVILLRCLPSVNVTVTTELIGERTVKEQASHFVVGICINIKHLKYKNFTTEFTVTNEIMGNQASIKEVETNFSIQVSEANRKYCRNITVLLKDHRPGQYKFTTIAKMNEEKILKVSEFSRSWVTLSPLSVMDTTLEVSRHCTGTDCDPDLSMSIQWETETTTLTDRMYEIGSSDSVSVNVTVTNNGSSSFDACAKIRLAGAPVALIGCGKQGEEYTCYMRKPLMRFEKQTIMIKFNMSRLTNMDKLVDVQVDLYYYCDRLSDNDTITQQSYLLLTLNTSQVVVKGTSYNQTVSDAKIEDKRTNYIRSVQEYLVTNEGTVAWNSITSIVSIQKQSFIETTRISFQNLCERFETNETVAFNCTFTLMPYTTTKFIVINDLPKDKIVNNLIKGKLNIETNFHLVLSPTDEVKVSSLVSTIEFRKELSIGHNIGLVIFLAILGAIIILAVVIFILYKMEFFKRKEKTRLEALKQDHIRRQSIKHSTSAYPNADVDDFIEMEVDDDSPFEIVDMSEPVLKQDNSKSADR